MEITTERLFIIICISLLLIISMLNLFISDCTSKVALVTGNTLIANSYVWNIVTSCFFEIMPIKIVLDISMLLFITKTLRIDNWEQFGLYFVLSILSCTIGTSAYCFIRFFATSLEEMLMMPIYGFGGVFMSLLMYNRSQLKNEPIISSFPQLTYHNLPIIVIVSQLLLWLVGFRFMALDLPFTIVALFFCWSYLRFYYRFEDNGSLGNNNDDFAFVRMFPEPLHPIVTPLTIGFYNIFAMVGIFPALEQVETTKRPQHHLNYAQPKLPESPFLPAKQDIVMERRRAKAMKLLDAKMAELSQESEGWDDAKDNSNDNNNTKNEPIDSTLKV